MSPNMIILKYWVVEPCRQLVCQPEQKHKNRSCKYYFPIGVSAKIENIIPDIIVIAIGGKCVHFLPPKIITHKNTFAPIHNR